MRWLQRHWQRTTALSTVLLPLAWGYRAAVALRRWLYRHGVLRVERLPVPVIVVGNLTLGGTGKTPLVLWLAHALRARGYAPGIVARGYGGRAAQGPITVDVDAEPAEVGDESLVLARNGGCPVVVSRRRAAAAVQLITAHGCDLILADDGLQHYALARDIEIAVIDGTRRFGNGRCLPAGPLREPLRRLREIDLRVSHGEPGVGEFAMRLRATGLRRVAAPEVIRRPEAFAGQHVHAVAGIGYPPRFFAQLRVLGMDVIAHPFPDHHPFVATELCFADALPVIMTEKDAVKCRRFADERLWYLEVEADPDPALLDEILRRLPRRTA